MGCGGKRTSFSPVPDIDRSRKFEARMQNFHSYGGNMSVAEVAGGLK